ncbi:TonB-dependent receptor plug domain-containing protein [Psychroserpens sp.]
MKIKHILVLLCIATSTLVFSQKKKKMVLSGIVTDSLNNPVSNAIVFLDDYKTNKTTNKKGYFKLKVKDLPNSISAYSEKYGFKTSICCEDNKIDISFDDNSLENGKFVELMALQELKKRESNTELYFNNIYDYLRAKAPMLRISGTNQIRVRGYDSSFISSSEPLFIVNGSPTSNIVDLVPANINTVSVLKDSSAASYGVRGANGVIIIITK